MDGLLPPLRSLGWDAPLLEKRGPKFFKTYCDLWRNNPYLLQWDLQRDRLLRKEMLAQINYRLRQAWENFEDAQVDEYTDLKRRNENYLAQAHHWETARVLQLQGNDRLMVWDYDGAIECFTQASEIDERVQPRAAVEELREKLVTRKIEEARLDLVVSISNSIFMSRVYEGLGQRALSGLLSVGLVRRAPMRGGAPPIKGFTGYVSCFADKVWGAVNPFKDVVKAIAVDRNMKEIQKALTTLDAQLQQELYVQVTRAAMMNWLDVKWEYAEFIANALVNTATFRDARQGYDLLITELVRGLRNAASRYPSREFSVGAYNERDHARKALGGDLKYLNLLRNYWEVVQRNEGGDLAGEVAKTEARLRSVLNPLDGDIARQRLSDIEAATDPKKRMEAIAGFFRDYPLVEKGVLRNFVMRQKKENPTAAAEINDKVNNLRFELFFSALVEFVNTKPQYAALFLNFIPVGAAATKGGAKKSLTDVDYTAWLKENATDEQRLVFQKDFDTFVESRFKLTLGHLDTAIAAQIRPDPQPVLESVQRLLGLTELPLGDPVKLQELRWDVPARNELAKKLNLTPEQVNQLLENPQPMMEAYKRQLEGETQRLLSDALHKEIYFDRANEWLINVGALLFGSPKSPQLQGNDLANLPKEEYDQAFNDLKKLELESFMAFNQPVGQMGFLMRHKEPALHKKTGEPYVDENGNLVVKDPIDYHKYVSKYPGARGLMGAIMMSPRGRNLLREVTTREHLAWKRQQYPKAWQSMEEILVDVAKSLISQPDMGLKELGLPSVKGDSKGDVEHYKAVFDMWLLRKNGASPELVASRALTDDAAWHAHEGGILRLKADDTRINTILAEHTRETEGFFRQQIGRSLVEMGNEIARLDNAAAEARKSGQPLDELRAKVCEEKIKNIFFNLANTWFRMRRDSHDQVVREALEWTMKQTPSMGSDWLYALAEAEYMGERVMKPDNKVDLDAMRAWKPKVVRKDDGALNKLIEQLRARSRTTPRLLDSKLGAGWD
ncbi:MAG: hypothetical protein AUJ92_09205 [Armatimonadetes bacterium CG2_30_59_28]|nr:hypothetical protein [Armatimonadota bacterium]OIO94802.1 MAG: hypothetical protein AUJ92_09205 [Armatimonadetes bacterium CG2_30_59_28]PIU66014.1 MAG: hypothetical protein COS85_06560 [Armatimonadetes bacterium CG07_land_8_20_14_0_80_59_28]PIY48170.1 MAG: hypothetical protein COZ05_03790 [Armatimonadetes bacterium CG_4_10_14_3_um_filter_59_10]